MEPLTEGKLAELREAWAKVPSLNLESDAYRQLKRWVYRLPENIVQQIADGNIKYLSTLAAQRLLKLAA